MFSADRPFLRKGPKDFMVHSRVDFQLATSIQWARKRVGNPQNSFQAVIINKNTKTKLRITWTKRI